MDRKTHRVIVGTLRFKLSEVVTVSAAPETRIAATYLTAKEPPIKENSPYKNQIKY